MAATGPSQGPTWDTTKTEGPVEDLWFQAYGITDILSRHTVGHAAERPDQAWRGDDPRDHHRGGIAPRTAHTNRGPRRCRRTSPSARNPPDRRSLTPVMPPATAISLG
ncbi:hypothetical protein GCM10010269_11780 [Streptomyces humidus]|uniref:Uncharacterized protein n=1 Tax=Streptomyces humidus TaxID=52259 RepID=A0A918FRU0_9ACTN|nr:hypothetical protein GCM10010269_11780 [Streptomyces humidus]